MYCENCHRDNPDNFDTCIYCGTSMLPENRVSLLKSRNSLRQALTPLRIFSVLFILCAIAGIIGFAVAKTSEEHPEAVAKAYAAAVTENNVDSVYALYDSGYRSFMIDNYYYSQKEMKSKLASDLGEMFDFYTSECGTGFEIDCEASDFEYADAAGIAAVNSFLTSKYKYTAVITDAARYTVTLSVKGKQGDYLTVINDYTCIKLDGVWYKCDVCPADVFEAAD